MLKHGEIGTEVDKKPFLFTLTAAVVSLIAAILLFTLGGGDALSVFAGVLVSVVALVSLFILFVMLTDYAYIEDGVLHLRYLMKKKSIPLGNIGKITYKDGVYSVHNRKGDTVGTVNGLATGIDGILQEFDKNGIRFE